MTSQLNGRVGIVTGAGRGIGSAVAAKLAELGAGVVACSRNQEDLDRLVEEIRDRGGEATSFVGDVRKYSDMLELAATCMRVYDGIDFAVANAGVVVMGTMADGDPEEWRRLLETNVLGAAHTARAVLPAMREQKRGDLVIISSASGRVTYTGEPMYVASKWALSGLGGCLRKEAKEYNVRVTLIEPGLVDTPMIRASEEGLGWLAEGRPLTGDDCANAVAYVLSQPDHVTIAQLAVLPTDQSFTY